MIPWLQKFDAAVKAWTSPAIKAGVVIVLVLGLALIVSAMRKGRAGSERASAARSVLVKRGDLVICVSGDGDIQSCNSQKILVEFRQQSSIRFLVEEGSRVQPGDVLVKFSTDEIDNRIQNLESALTEKENSHDQAVTDLEIQKIDNEASLKTAYHNVTNAVKELEQFLQADAPLERRIQEVEAETSSNELVRKENRIKEVQSLLEQGFVTEDEVDEARIAVQRERIFLETARIKLRNLKAYTHPLKHARLKNDLAKARTELTKTLKNNSTRLTSKQRVLKIRKSQLDRAGEELDTAREERDKYEIKAPCEGVVQYGDPSEGWRRNEISVGKRAYQGQTIMTIPDLSRLKAVVNIAEADIHMIALEQKVVLHTDALVGRAYEGCVSKVAEVPNKGGWLQSDVKEYAVDIDIVQGEGLKPGYSCAAEIVTAVRSNVLFVPVQAVFRAGDEFVVYTDGALTLQRREVQIGQASVTDVEILDGLSKGESVLLHEPGVEQEL